MAQRGQLLVQQNAAASRAKAYLDMSRLLGAMPVSNDPSYESVVSTTIEQMRAHAAREDELITDILEELKGL